MTDQEIRQERRKISQCVSTLYYEASAKHWQQDEETTNQCVSTGFGT